MKELYYTAIGCSPFGSGGLVLLFWIFGWLLQIRALSNQLKPEAEKLDPSKWATTGNRSQLLFKQNSIPITSRQCKQAGICQNAKDLYVT